MKRLIHALALSVVLVGSASAADLGHRAPAPVLNAAASPVYNWTGLYLGANVGYSWNDADVSDVTVNGAAYAYTGSKLNTDGFSVGGQIGYNYQLLNNIVLGIEADLQWADQSDTNSLGDTAKVDYFGTVRGRVGYAVDRFLPYVTGGLAYAHGKVSLAYPEGTYKDDKVLLGWTIGGGVEYAITNNLSAKAEYLYTDFSGETYNWTRGANAISAENSLSGSTVRLGLNYKF
jgi:outer membrane immunogenic protein